MLKAPRNRAQGLKLLSTKEAVAFVEGQEAARKEGRGKERREEDFVAQVRVVWES